MAGYRKLNKQSDQRKALLRSLVTNLVMVRQNRDHAGARKRDARSMAEKLITLAVREYENTVKAVKEVVSLKTAKRSKERSSTILQVQACGKK